MLFNFLPQLAIVLSLAGIFYVFLRKAEAVQVAENKLLQNSKQNLFKLKKVKKLFVWLAIIDQKVARIISKSFKKGFSVSVKTNYKKYIDSTSDFFANNFNKAIASAKEKQTNLKTSLKKYSKQKKQKLNIKNEKKPTNTVSAIIAERRYIQLITADPRNTDAYLKLGRLYKNQANLTDARASFEQVLKLDPENIEAKQELENF